jgi:hypothetical protein
MKIGKRDGGGVHGDPPRVLGAGGVADRSNNTEDLYPGQVIRETIL